MASRALADSPGGGGGSRLGRLSPLGESEEVTDATDVEESSGAFAVPDDDDDVTDGRMSAAIEKRLDARGSLATVVVRLGSCSESGLTGVEPPGPLRSSSALPPSAELSGRPRVGESPSPPPPAFETICATVLAAVAAFWNFPVYRHFGRGG